MDDFESRWSHAVSYANRAGGIIPGEKMSLDVGVDCETLKPHWRRWVSVGVALYLLLSSWGALLYMFVSGEQIPPGMAATMPPVGLVCVYFIYRATVPVGRIVFCSESFDIRINYGSIFKPCRIVVPGERTSVKAYVFGLRKSAVRARSGRVVLALIRQDRPDDELVLAVSRSSNHVATILENLSFYKALSRDKNRSGV